MYRSVFAEINILRACFYTGEHPRIGALDVCPFVPVSNVTMEECVECSREFGRRLASELEVPIYLYEEAQQKDYRKSLAQIRQGQYEKLPTRVGLPVEKISHCYKFIILYS